MNREEAILTLKSFIQSHTSETGSVDCYDDGRPVAFHAELLLKGLEQEEYPESCEQEYIEQVELETACFICRSKHPSPTCECCGTCPSD